MLVIAITIHVSCNSGLDVDDIRMVVNFDFPNNHEDYVHRGTKGYCRVDDFCVYAS